MEKLPVKLKELSPIIINIIEKIQSMSSNTLSKEEKILCAQEMLKEADNFRKFFQTASSHENIDEKTKMFNERIERAFNLFDWNTNVAIHPYDFRKYSENGKTLIKCILKLLGTKGCGILIIDTYLRLSMSIGIEMQENTEIINSSTDIINLKVLLESVFTTVNLFKKYWHIAFFDNQKTSIILCLNQICKYMPPLLKAFEKKNFDIKRFFLRLLGHCLTKILDIIHFNENLKKNEVGQEFLILMDFCLYKLSDLADHNSDYSEFIHKAKETFQSLKPMIDEILYYVMSVAQVINFKTDYEVILISSQKVLKEFNDLNNDINQENVNQIKLSFNSVADVLCSLEQVVNTAMLKLVLEVFSNTNHSLKNLVNKCRKDISSRNKTPEDLKILISDFDTEMDKIVQICLFAIACSSDKKRILGIQSCLASLESLETELILSLTALYVDSNFKNKANFQFFIDVWLNEITELRILIDSVVDPAAFCQVANIQIKSLLMTMKEDLINNKICKNKLKYILKQIIQYSRKLIITLKSSMEDEKRPTEKTSEHLRYFQLGIQECEAIFDLVENEGDIYEITNKALRRCDFLLENLQKLNSHLLDLLSDNELSKQSVVPSETSTELNIKAPPENYYTLCNHSCLYKSFPSGCDADLLTPYINKAIERSKKKNILYNTLHSQENSENEIASTLKKEEHWYKAPVSRNRSRCCKVLSLDLELENTIDLEITTVLENLTNLSNILSESLQSKTYNKSEKKKEKGTNSSCKIDKGCSVESRYTSSGCCTDSAFLENASEIENLDNNLLGTKLRTQFLKSLSNLSQETSLLLTNCNEDNFELDTPGRVSDLKKVEEKINFLKQHVPGLLL